MTVCFVVIVCIANPPVFSTGFPVKIVNFLLLRFVSFVYKVVINKVENPPSSQEKTERKNFVIFLL